VTRKILCSALVTYHLSLLAQVGPAPPEDNFDSIREAFLAKINATRKGLALPPLRLSATLSRLAQRRAEEIEAGAAAPDEPAAVSHAAAAAKAGYDSKFLSEVVVQAEGDIPMIYAEAAEAGGAFAGEIAGSEARDLGVGVSLKDEIPVYVFLFAFSWEDFVSARREEFSDLPRVRRELQTRVNQERASRGLAPLRQEPLLDETARRHAQDMLARSYYGHESPEGSTVLDRSKLAGYRPRFIAENVAQGQHSVQEVMAGWMASETHRENILSPLFVEVGSGVAVGKNAKGYQILWVQCFGRPRDANPPRRRQIPSKE
jgi:uncharacterized protein YkwD